MQYQKIHETSLEASRIIMGCMHLSELNKKDAHTLIATALDCGINYFDHANMYDDGKCEERFAEAAGMKDDLREKVIIQSKVGIRHGCYDFSRAYMIKEVEGSLKRLKTSYLDVLLLHRPDTLMEPEEIAEAFDYFHNKGMVRYFGVSNQHPLQMKLIQRYVKQKLIVNQLQLSMTFAPMLDAGLNVNMKTDQSTDRNGYIMEYCRLHDITIQAWSPYQYGHMEGVYIGDRKKFPALNKEIDKVAEKYGIKPEGVVTAWISRHPAKIQAVIGTTKPARMKECAAGADVRIDREEWYSLYRAAGQEVP